MKKLASALMLMMIAWPTQAMEICPEKMQAVLMVKIIPFVNEYQTGQRSFNIRIGVYEDTNVSHYLLTAAQRVSFGITVVLLSGENPQIENLKAVYLPAGTPRYLIEKISGEAKKLKILTICGDPSLAQDYNVSLSFYILNEKPKILVNLTAAAGEGLSFSSKMLRIADVRHAGH